MCASYSCVVSGPNIMLLLWYASCVRSFWDVCMRNCMSCFCMCVRAVCASLSQLCVRSLFVHHAHTCVCVCVSVYIMRLFLRCVCVYCSSNSSYRITLNNFWWSSLKFSRGTNTVNKGIPPLFMSLLSHNKHWKKTLTIGKHFPILLTFSS